MALRLLDGPAATTDMAGPFKTLGDFDLVELVGRGGMGEVHLAIRRGAIPRIRAVKILHPDLVRQTDRVVAFRREAEIGMQLGRHDSIVAVHDIHQTLVGDPACPERVLYLELDFVDGVSLRRFADRFHRAHAKRLPLRIVVHVIRAMLRALEAAHGHAIGSDALPVVHGDVNPGNVLISSRGEVRVTDFGISRFVPEPAFISRPVGTLPYMAPEQYLGRICPQNDLYAVGAVLHELLAGSPPLPEGGSPRTRERRLFEEPVLPVNRDDVPPALERLRRGLLEKNVELRIQTAFKALDLLNEVDRSDCADELKAIYRRMFGPPRSRMTGWLQAQGNTSGSFVMELLRRYERPTTTDETGHDGPSIAGSTPQLEPAAAEATRDDGGMPWLAEEDDEQDDEALTAEVLTTEMRRRTAPRLSPTVRLDLPVGAPVPFGGGSTPTVPEAPPTASTSPADPATLERPEASSDGLRAAGPLLEPMEDEDGLDAVTTAPRRAANARAKPTPNPRRYPPRPPHLEDGAPFQRRRPSRCAIETDLPVEPRAPGSTARNVESASSGAATAGTGPHQTRPRRASETRPDAVPVARPTKLPRPPEGSTARWMRSAFVTMTAVLLVACGIGLVALALTEPESALASPHDPHPAAMTTTEATDG